MASASNDALPFGPGALVCVGLYALSLLAIGAYAHKKRRGENLSDFFLAGRDMGFVVLLLTLYATQYSGNTLFGFSGAAYRHGLSFLVCVHFMTAIVIAYLLLAPALYRRSRDRQYITPGDFIFDRFQSPALRTVVTLLMLFALCNFTLAQMKTMGTAFAGISQGRVPMEVGVIGLAVIMLIYESLGGMRSVAWTDVIQGGILFIGFAVLLVLALTQIESLPSAIEQLAGDPERAHKIMPPPAEGVRSWLSYILIVGLGAAIYPQALQRIYCARNATILKRSLAVMGFLPLFTALIAVIVGVVMAARHPELASQSLAGNVELSETVLPLLCLDVMQQSAFGYALVVLIFSAILAALMSTADSALLSISSMITKDLYQPLRPTATETDLTQIGKRIPWIAMIPIVWGAIGYQGTLVQLLELKFELLIQCVPVFYLGVHWQGLTARTALIGIAVGLTVTLALSWSGDLGLADANQPKLWGLHSGLYGLTANFLVCAWDGLPRPKKMV